MSLTSFQTARTVGQTPCRTGLMPSARTASVDARSVVVWTRDRDPARRASPANRSPVVLSDVPDVPLHRFGDGCTVPLPKLPALPAARPDRRDDGRHGRPAAPLRPGA